VTGKTGGRANQRLRTRKDLLDAANRLMRDGGRPSFEEIAEAALVSRATAYRYFPGLEALLFEAGLDLAMPAPVVFFAGDTTTDPLVRLERLEAALFRMIDENNAPMRMLLARSLHRSVDPEHDPAVPVRQNRRGPLIAAALAPARDQFADADLDTLSKALVVLLGIEAEVAFKDVVRADTDEAKRIRLWMIRTLVEAARRR
jgi:AcrR family transcriptional regulator